MRESGAHPGFGWAALASGLLVAAFGIVQMAAWHLQWTAALRITPGSVPMMYNTALALAVTGVAVATAARGASRWIRVAGVVDLMLGAPVLAQDAFGWDLRIDQLFVRAHLLATSEHPGRMAVNTALCLVVMGASLLAWRLHATRWHRSALAAGGAVVASVAVVALFGYLAGLPHAYAWSPPASMSVQTALSMLVVASSLLALSSATRTRLSVPVAEWIALPAGTAAFAISLILWQVFADMGRSTTISAAGASRAALFLSLLTGGMLALMTWLAQHANAGRREARGLTAALQEEMERRELAERSVRDSELLLFQLLDAVPVGLFICTPDGRPYFANQVANTLLGGPGARHDLTADELTTVFTTCIAGTDQPYPPETLPAVRAAAGVSSHVDDIEVHRPDGVFPVEAWGAPLTDDDGRVRFGLAALVDISKRRAVERSLIQHAALLDMAHDVIYIKDAHHRLTYWNRGAEITYGWTREEAIGQVVYELLRTELPEPMESIEAAVRRDGQWDGELVQHTKYGERRVVSSRFVAEYTPDGTLCSFMTINIDITARKQAEAELARRAEELRTLNLELTRSNDELEQFAYIASHDLSEPLRAISGPISLLARRYEGQLDADADGFISFAVDGCERMQTLINDLLAFSRIGRLQVSGVEVDANVVADTAVAALQMAILDGRAHVTRDDLPRVSASASQLGQLFQNLVANAIKFASPGVEPRVHIGARQVGDDWRFAVTDNGIGVESEHRERVFGMFKRLHTRTAYPGTGIGLALCRKIVERHHGLIGIDDGPDGLGSTVWFTLPLRKDDLS
jgi:PAS domain S-box-containing protein